MNRIDSTFKKLASRRGKALIAYLTAGFPSLAALPDWVKLLVNEGVDLIELGVPFSDPLADGPTIQGACAAALRQGVTPGRVLQAVERIRRQGVALPVALLTYVNPVARYGFQRFCKDSVASGVDGVILPDLPPEEARELIASARPRNLSTIFLTAPTSPPERLKRIVKATTGFLYCVSLTGVTGARVSLPAEIRSHVARLKRMTNLPVCVGFGISRPGQVSQVVEFADGAIVGSALLDLISRARGNRAAVASFVRKLRKACHG